MLFRSTVQDDMRVAGAGIEITGTVGDDAFLAGGGGPAAIPVWPGTRSIDPGLRLDGEVGGDAAIVGGSADISGAIGGDFFGGLWTLDLSGTIGDDADIAISELRIADGARIGGALRYTAEEKQEFSAGVASDIRFEESAEEGFAETTVGAIWRWLLRTIAIVAGVAIVGWLLLRFAPNALARPVAAIRAKPLETGLYGLLAAVLLIFIPIVSIVLVVFFWTLWGALPGIVMFVFLFASLALIWFLSPLLTGLWLGESINARLGGDSRPLAVLLSGALLLIILGRIPFLGGVVYLLSFVLTLGALLRSGIEARGPVERG